MCIRDRVGAARLKALWLLVFGSNPRPQPRLQASAPRHPSARYCRDTPCCLLRSDLLLLRGFDRDRDCVWFDRDCGNAFGGRWRAQAWDHFGIPPEPQLASACKEGHSGGRFFLDGALWWCFFLDGALWWWGLLDEALWWWGCLDGPLELWDVLWLWFSLSLLPRLARW